MSEANVTETAPPASRRDSLRTEEMLLNMGPQHPSTHGVLRLVVRTDGEMVRESWPQIGFLHRCFEKIAESLPYAQALPYADRMDYLGSVNNGLAFCLGVEKLGAIEVSERAAHLRVIAAELNRIASHLIAFGTYALDLGAFTPFIYGFREREMAVSILEKLSGGRLLYHYPRIGGVANDLTPEIASDIRAFLVQMRKVWPEYNALLSDNQIFVKRTANVGVVTREQAIAWGFTGPCLRASGVRFDLRKDQPYSLYERFAFDVPIGEGTKGTTGDCWDRYWVRMVEILESCRIVEQALDGIPEGPVLTKVPRVLKLPKGEVYVPCENPRGELGFYIVSDGDPKALRIKSRGPSFCNLSIVNEICRDVLLADVVAILGSIDIVLGEVDR
ncbi:NADH-quinone oxidoreductase subunit D [Candidatus Sumerlaeota bacterium]|nr:NADH-quinone oxidoreductase subunit D [Candidatus Sumerlaeota bacterium]